MKHPVFRRRSWFRGRPIRAGGARDIGWFRPDGSEMTPEDWHVGFAKSLGVYLNGRGIPDLDSNGQRIVDDTFLVVFNAHYEPLDFIIPDLDWGKSWLHILDTTRGFVEESGPRAAAGTSIRLGARSTVILRRVS